MMLMRRPPHCGHHAVLEVRERHLAAPCPDQRLEVQLLGVVALPGRVRLLDSAVDAFRMDTPSRRQSIAESIDGHENN